MDVPFDRRTEEPVGVVNVEWGGDTIALVLIFADETSTAHLACLLIEPELQSAVAELLEEAAAGYRHASWQAVLFDDDTRRSKRSENGTPPHDADDIPF